MARKIIIQRQVTDSSDLSVEVVFWPSVPSGRETPYTSDSATSVVKDASALEVAEIRAGRVREFVDVLNVPKGSATATMKSQLIQRFNKYQAVVTSDNPGKFFGTSWDGTTWTDGGSP